MRFCFGAGAIAARRPFVLSEVFMKQLVLLWAMFSCMVASASQLTIAVTLAMDAGTLAELSAAVTAMNDVVPTRLVVQGIPLDHDWAKRPYWMAKPQVKSQLRAEILQGWTQFAKAIPGEVEIDPEFFRRYRISDAPVFVLQGDREVGNEVPAVCDKEDSASLKAQDDLVVIVRGNVTAGFAVREMEKALSDAGREGEKLLPLVRKLEGLNQW